MATLNNQSLADLAHSLNCFVTASIDRCEKLEKTISHLENVIICQRSQIVLMQLSLESYHKWENQLRKCDCLLAARASDVTPETSRLFQQYRSETHAKNAADAKRNRAKKRRLRIIRDVQESLDLIEKEKKWKTSG